MNKPKIGVVGLAVMGSNLAQNIESRGFACAVFNRSTQVTEDFMLKVKGRQFVSGATLKEFVQAMDKPRQILIMVKAGDATEAVVDALIPLVDKGDIIIDGGNAYFKDTQRREQKCRDAGVNFLGVGISGGEEGALKGPSLMPGGPKEGWRVVAPLLEKISAKVDGQPCTGYVGPDGAGHYVKMVHNGIEYGDMQLIAEAYHLLSEVGGAQPPQLAEIFKKWNLGVLSSFLVEITAKIFLKRDDLRDGFLVDAILDKAGQKGTGKWTAIEALELGVAVPTLIAAVDARVLSSQKDERIASSKILLKPLAPSAPADLEAFVNDVHDALYCSKIMAYAQGMALLAAASKHYQWDLKLDEIASMWKGGCIIRAAFLDQIRKAFSSGSIPNLLCDKFICVELNRSMSGLRRTVQIAAGAGIAIPGFASAMAYFDSYRSADLPQNLTQAQRDCFGAHTYERKDRPGVFHSHW